jgi:hypothetical protein
MYKIRIIFILFIISILLISCSNPTQSTNEFIDIEEGFYNIISENGEMIASLFWDENTFTSDTKIIVYAGDSFITPTNIYGENVALNYPIKFTLIDEDVINFTYSSLKLRIYANIDIFALNDISPNIELFQVNHDSLFEAVSGTINYEENYIERYLPNVENNTSYTFLTSNIITETYEFQNLSTIINEDILIPSGHNVVFPAGFNLSSDNGSQLYVNGTLQCQGVPANFVTIDLDVVVRGDMDEDFNNNLDAINLNYSNIKSIVVNNANGNIQNSSGFHVGFGNYSLGNVLNCSLDRVFSSKSKVLVDSSSLNSNGYPFSVNDGYLEIKNSIIPLITSEINNANSVLILSNNIIYSDTFLAFLMSINCFLEISYNKIYFAGDDNHNRDGLNVYSDNIAIIHNNLIEGFRTGISIDYHNKAIIYNNTLVNNDDGISTTGQNDFFAIYNNIFVSEHYAINLDGSSGNVDIAYINNNCWSNYGTYGGYISNEYTTIVGNTFTIHSDPLFIDEVSYHLSPESPAIDTGTTELVSEGGSFEIFGEVYQFEPYLELIDYSGTAPDMGAFEYDGN